MISYKILILIIVLQFFMICIALYHLIDGFQDSGNKVVKNEICHQSIRPNQKTPQAATNSKDIINQEADDKSELRKGSSVYCYGRSKQERICKFHNLCYHKKWQRFIFYHGPWSLLRGIPNNRFDPAFLDMTSVDDHNTQYFNYVDFPIVALENEFKDVEFVNGLSFIFNRFNPENLMHVIHDDLIPLFATLAGYATPHTNTLNFGANLVMLDGREKGPWYKLYEKLAKNIILNDNITAEMTCFKQAIVGLSKETTWYQYGFKKPQGPIDHKNIDASILRYFGKFMKHDSKCTDSTMKYVILISRKRTRLILNQLEVSVTLANIFNKEIYFLDIEDHGVEDTICIVSQADAIVGMHGAELILSLFLPKGATVVELFPYAVNPDNYTPYKTLAKLLHLKYIAWRNMNVLNSRGYPERPKESGGLQHLSKGEQLDIINAKDVPMHICCGNPYWLFKMYQDTFVDVASFKKLIVDGLNNTAEAINNTNKNKNNTEGRNGEDTNNNAYNKRQEGWNEDIHFYPDRARNINCVVKASINNTLLEISWKRPVNSGYLKGTLIYQVLVQEGPLDGQIHAYELTNTNLSIIVKGHSLFRVWVRGKAESMLGPLSNTVNCDSDN